MDFKEYIKEIDRLYHVGNTTEHSFRGALASYLQGILKHYVVTNEPRRIDCGAPDYVITLKDVPVAFLEAKDIDDRDLDGRKEHKAQFSRYKESLDRIIFTDYLDFHMYLGGVFADSVRIAETKGEHIIGIPDNEAKFKEMILHLATEGSQRITSSAVLAKHMAAKAHLLADAVKKRLEIDGENGSGDIPSQLRSFREHLIHDLKAAEFADIYAQTITYGLFTARLNDKTPEDFSRREAAELVPKSNPFLRKLFDNITGIDRDDSIAWIVDDLASMFAVTDSEKIMRNYGSNKRHSDPIVHFYEDFLAEYDPKLRKNRGVWYTPAPVVKFIVKSVDEILQSEFGLPDGLANDSTIKIDHAIDQTRDDRTKDGKKHELIDVHRVQILDPATGTGTFLAEVIQQIRDKFEGSLGMWPSYVEKNLIPRIHGFEILMASYTIAHLKLAHTLKASGYENLSNQRLKIYLTNSLEEATPRTDNLFSKWLSDEADEASRVKTETPVMICIGNPPYSGESSNKGNWIKNLMEDYKREPGGIGKLNERNPKWINNDYVKFIRLAQDFIQRKNEGIVAFINPDGYLDNPTFRGMRWSLLQTFDKIYTLDLHGDAEMNKLRTDGFKDENVFDIKQAVSINFFIKAGKKQAKTYAKVYHAELWGAREEKYAFLDTHSFSTVDYKAVSPALPMFFFKPKDLSLEGEYNKGYSMEEMFTATNVGVVTANDDSLVNYDKDALIQKVKDCFGVVPESEKVFKYAHRLFDCKYVYYDTSLVARPRESIMKHFVLGDNLSLVCKKGFPKEDDAPVFVADGISDFRYWSCSGMNGGDYVFPLWNYDSSGNRESSISQSVIQKFIDILGFKPDSLSIFDYTYGVLNCPSYWKKYHSLIELDFPRAPYPKSEDMFKQIVALGKELRELHLMKDASSWPRILKFPIVGDNIVEKVQYLEGKVYINKAQYFEGVSEESWHQFIGGYQPAQKWLKDHKGRALDYNELCHYGHIIYALLQTDRIMKKIDEIGVD